MIEYGLERKVSEHSSLAVSMTVGVPTGVMLKIKYYYTTFCTKQNYIIYNEFVFWR